MRNFTPHGATKRPGRGVPQRRAFRDLSCRLPLARSRHPPPARPPRRSLAGGRDMGRDFAIRPVLAGWGAFTVMRRPTNRRAKLQTLPRPPSSPGIFTIRGRRLVYAGLPSARLSGQRLASGLNRVRHKWLRAPDLNLRQVQEETAPGTGNQASR